MVGLSLHRDGSIGAPPREGDVYVFGQPPPVSGGHRRLEDSCRHLWRRTPKPTSPCSTIVLHLVPGAFASSRSSHPPASRCRRSAARPDIGDHARGGGDRASRLRTSTPSLPRSRPRRHSASTTSRRSLRTSPQSSARRRLALSRRPALPRRSDLPAHVVADGRDHGIPSRVSRASSCEATKRAHSSPTRSTRPGLAVRTARSFFCASSRSAGSSAG